MSPVDPIHALWWSNAPVATGYGMQTSLWVPRLASLGWRVTIFAYYGIQSSTSQWNGHLMVPGGQDPYGSDIGAAHVERIGGVDLVVTLMDSWVLDKTQIRDIQERLGVPVCHWMPVDTQRLSDADEKHLLETKAFPIAMSRHGETQLKAKGFDCAYVPHGVDCRVFKPPENREALRERMNLKGRFAIVAPGTNKDQVRKAYPEVFEAFRIFRERHPEANALLLVHALRAAPTGLNLLRMAERKNIADAVAFSDQYAYQIGQISQENLADLFGGADVLLMPSYGEGFGVPAIEAMACGTPVILNDTSAMSELCGSGWKVRGQPFYNDFHGENWQVPFISDIVRALEKAYDMWKRGTLRKKREQARAFALQYDADRVLQEHWVPVLKRLESMTRKAKDSQRDRALTLLSDAWSGGALNTEEFGKRAQLAVSGDGDLESVTVGLEAA